MRNAAGAQTTPRYQGLRQQYPDATLEDALELMDNLPRHTMRIVEELSIDHGCHRCEVTMDFRLPAAISQPTLVLVPFLTLDRGQSLDNFNLLNAGESVTVLSRWETEELYGSLLFARFEESFKAFKTQAGNYRAPFIAAQQTLLGVSRGHVDAAANCLSALEALTVRLNPVQQASYEKLRQLVVDLGRVYYLVASVTTSSPRIKIKYAYDRPFTNLENAGSTYLTFRRITGQRPYSFMVPTPLAGRTDSYHLRMQGPQGFYLRSARFCRPAPPVANQGKNSRITEDLEDDIFPKLQRSQLGLPYGHLYLPKGTLRRTDDLRASLRFLEIPPGTLGLSALLNVALAAILVAFTVFLHKLVTTDITSDVPLVVLAVPVAAAIWLQSVLADVDQSRGSLSARLGMYLNAVGSLFASLLYIIGRVEAGGWLFDVAWYVLTAAAVGLAVTQVKSLVAAFNLFGETVDKGA